MRTACGRAVAALDEAQDVNVNYHLPSGKHALGPIPWQLRGTGEAGT